jgi:hypothetical protein
LRDNPSQKTFPVTTRELGMVASDGNPPIKYHSLIVEAKHLRYSEFVIFHSAYVYPEYLIAYQRFNGVHGPV